MKFKVIIESDAKIFGFLYCLDNFVVYKVLSEGLDLTEKQTVTAFFTPAIYRHLSKSVSTAVLVRVGVLAER